MVPSPAKRGEQPVCEIQRTEEKSRFLGLIPISGMGPRNDGVKALFNTVSKVMRKTLIRLRVRSSAGQADDAQVVEQDFHPGRIHVQAEGAFDVCGDVHGSEVPAVDEIPDGSPADFDGQVV